MKNQLILLLFLFGAGGLLAQMDTLKLKQRYDTATILQTRESRFTLNGKKLKPKQLKVLLLSYPESAVEYGMYKKNKTRSQILLATAGVAYVAALALPANPEIVAGALFLSLGSVIASIPFHNNNRAHLNRAVWLYNRSVISGEQMIAGAKR